MKEELIAVLKELGQEGITAFYVYLVVDYVSLWVFIGLGAWGVRAVWNKMKDSM